MFPPVLALSIVLALTLVLAKIPLAYPYGHWEGFPSWIAITTEDLSLIVGLLGFGTLIDRFFGRRAAQALAGPSESASRAAKWAKAQKAFRLSLRLIGVLFAIYAVMNISINAALRQPLNSRVLLMMKHVGDMSSSCAAYLTWQFFTWVTLAPLFVWFGSWGLQKLQSYRLVLYSFLAICALWIGGGTLFLWSKPPDAWQRRAGRNPHREIVGSFLFDAFLGGRVNVVGPFPSEYLADFRSAADWKMEPVAVKPKNVIIFVLESTSAQYLSLYGASYDTTPNLLAEAQNSLIFDRAYAQVGYTFCSFMTLVYSVYPGLPWLYRPDGGRPLTTGLAGLLKERGYRTSFLAAANPSWGGMDYMARRAGIGLVVGPKRLAPNRMATSFGCEDGPLVEGMMKWIDEDPTKPFFTLAWTDQTHHPYTVSQDSPTVTFTEDGQPMSAEKNRYLNAVRQADYQIGRIFQFLRQRGLEKDTLVVITGDHGESFGDSHPIMGHGNGIFDENLRVPLVFWSPTLFAGGQHNPKPAGHIDLNPTLAQMLGVPIPKDWQGCSLLSPEHPGRVYMVSDRDGFQFGVVDGKHKAIFYATAGYEQLFDLEADPLEQTDLSKKYPQRAGDLRARISAFIRNEEAYLKGEPLKAQ